MRFEIELAIKLRATVIPILVDNTRMPLVHELPDEIKELSRFHATQLSLKSFDAGMQQLVGALTEHLRDYKKQVDWGSQVVFSMYEQRRSVESSGTKALIEDLVGTREKPTPFRVAVKDLMLRPPHLAAVIRCRLRHEHPSLRGCEAAIAGGALVIADQEGLKKEGLPRPAVIGVERG